MKASIVAGALATGAAAQSGAWGQCGGQGWSGAKTCISGYTCTFVNDWYSQCLPGAAAPVTTTAKPTTTAQPTTLVTSKTSSPPAATTSAVANGKFKWFGFSESGAEFGQDTYPGLWGKHFIFPDNNAIQVGGT